MKQIKHHLTGDGVARFALPALITGAVAISFSAIFVRLSEVGPITTAFWRVALALPAFWLWMRLERHFSDTPARPLTKSNYRWLLMTGIFFAADLTTWHLSIKFTTVANSVLLANFAPVFVTLGGWLLFRQRVSRTFIAGLVLALFGATMLIGVTLNLNPDNLLGDILALVTAVFYGGYILSVKRLRDDLSTATIMTWVAFISALLLLPIALVSEDVFFPYTIYGWLVLLGLALFSHTGGQGLVTFALAHLPASFSSVTLLLQPVLSAVFAWLLLSEVLTTQQMIGGFIVLIGIFVARRGSQTG